MEEERQALIVPAHAAGGPPRARRKRSLCFVFIIFAVIGLVYAAYTFVILVPDVVNAARKWLPITVGAAFQSLFVLFMASMISAMRTEPGQVPQHWGFYVGEDQRRRRYCRVCEKWKPDRTHHCSQCGRCVLNMDHHCPWINNCVGFYNRKFFVQTLVYANLCLLVLVAHSIMHLTEAALEFNNRRLAGPIEYLDWGCSITLVSFIIVLLAGLIPFTRFHWHLLVVNSTTIETMDVSNRADESRYDLGALRNIQQVFGPTAWLWWLPMHVARSYPNGDGIRWRRHYLSTESV